MGPARNPSEEPQRPRLRLPPTAPAGAPGQFPAALPFRLKLRAPALSTGHAASRTRLGSVTQRTDPTLSPRCGRPRC